MVKQRALDFEFRNPIRLGRVTPGFILFIGGYVAILAWFKEVDVYHREFSNPGAMTAVYNFCRVVYIYYFFCIVYQVGNFLLAGLTNNSWKKVTGIDRIAIGFFAGTGVCHAILLLLGYLGLYTIPVAIAITLPLVAFAYPDSAASLAAVRAAVAEGYSRRDWRAWSFGVVAAIALATAVALLLVKGLYPAGGHDYFLHYFGYYKAVIDHAGLWHTGNYTHAYDSKGDGLVYLSMLLTDAIAHQLVTFCFIAVGGLALHQILNRIAPGTLWPLAGVILYFALYIYTPGLGVYQANGGWGDFEKWHEFTTALTIAIVWLVSGCFEEAGGLRLLNAIAAASAVVAAVIIDYTFAIYLGLLFTLLGGLYFVQRQWQHGWTCIGLAATAAVALTVMIATNYMATGLFGDIAITAWWRFTNVERLHQTGILLQAISDYWSRIPLVPSTPLLSFATLKLLFLSLRLELLYPLAASGVLIAVATLLFRRGSRLPLHQTIILATALLAYVIFASVLGRNGSQEISFYRYSSFTLPITIAIGVLLWSAGNALAGTDSVRNILSFGAPIAVLAGCWAAAFAAYPPGHFLGILYKSADFAIGKSSIDKAYTDQILWPGRLPWGGIYPGARGAYAVVGPHVRMWSFHIHAYCMLPDCDLDPFFYTTMTGEDEQVFFGTPEEARSALQKVGLNYFLFSNELSIHDPVLGAPLFAPDNIAKYLGLRWTDGKTSLLTWLGPKTTPLDPRWLATYCRIATIGTGFFWGGMQKVFADLDSEPHPWRRFDLPWAGGQPFQSVPETGRHFICPPFPVEIISATYGQSCRSSNPQAPGKSIREGNVTRYVQKACADDTKAVEKCSFPFDDAHWADPAPGCSKDLTITYRCQPGEPPRMSITAAPAAEKVVHLDCSAPLPSGLAIRSASYDGNCGAPSDKATRELALACNGKTMCAFSPDTKTLRDSAPQCGDDFTATYSCAPNLTVLHQTVAAKADSSAILNLGCIQQPAYQAALLPHSTTGETLSFSNGQNAGAFVSGWAAPEPPGVWSSANAAYLGFVVDGTTPPKQAVVHASVWLVPGKMDEQRVQVWSTNKLLAEYDLKSKDLSNGSIDLKIPLNDIPVIKGKPVILGFYFPNARPTNQVLISLDARALALLVASLQLSP